MVKNRIIVLLVALLFITGAVLFAPNVVQVVVAQPEGPGPGDSGPSGPGPGDSGPSGPGPGDSGPGGMPMPDGMTMPGMPGMPGGMPGMPDMSGMMGPGGLPSFSMPADFTGGMFGPGVMPHEIFGPNLGPGGGTMVPRTGMASGMPAGIFGGNAGIFSGGITGMTGMGAPGAGAGSPGMGPGSPGAGVGSPGMGTGNSPFIPGTLVKMPAGMTVDSVMENFDPGKLGISMPSFMKPEDMAKAMKGEMEFDTMTQEMIKALNPGKFGPMAAPFAMSEYNGLKMDSMGNFLAQASQDRPGNTYIMRAKALEEEGKFAEAAGVLNDPNAPFANYPDALVHAYRAQLEVRAGQKQTAVNNIENALALAPFDDTLFKKAGEIFKEAGITGPKVFVNGVKPDFDVKPFVESGRTLVPFRALAETMGASVGWDQATQTVSVIKGDKTINMVIGSKTATVNGQPMTLDVPAQVVNGRTVVPLRFVGEGLDAEVGYDGATEIIRVQPKATI